MSKTKHTPGPWEVEYGHQQRNGTVYWQIHEGMHAICCNQFCYAPNSEANAHLIASAPDLLEALSVLIKYGCPVCSGDCAAANPPVLHCPFEMAHAAISRATEA